MFILNNLRESPDLLNEIYKLLGYDNEEQFYQQSIKRALPKLIGYYNIFIIILIYSYR